LTGGTTDATQRHAYRGPTTTRHQYEIASRFSAVVNLRLENEQPPIGGRAPGRSSWRVAGARVGCGGVRHADYAAHCVERPEIVVVHGQASVPSAVMGVATAKMTDSGEAWFVVFEERT
jgi:hypothetical protein